MLRDYPDQQAAQLIIQGISEGFCIGFDYTNHTLQSCDRNMVSARQHPQVVSDYLRQELDLGRISKLSSQDLVESLGIHISPFGVIPKRHKQANGVLYWICHLQKARTSMMASTKTLAACPTLQLMK